MRWMSNNGVVNEIHIDGVGPTCRGLFRLHPLRLVAVTLGGGMGGIGHRCSEARTGGFANLVGAGFVATALAVLSARSVERTPRGWAPRASQGDQAGGHPAFP